MRLSAAVFCRLLLNTARRFAYPFAPLLSRSLDVSLTAVTSIIAVNQATAVAGIFFGPIADRLGYRFMMVCGLVLLVSGMLWTGISPSYATLMLALFLAGLGKTIFDPAIQAYVGKQVSYQKRGFAIGFLEMSWAGSTLLGIPGIALLINWMGWRAPFIVLGGMGLAGLMGLWLLIPKDPPVQRAASERNIFGLAWRELVKNRSAAGALGYAFFISVANDSLFVIYGAWLESSFNISIILLGIGTSVIGAAELCGEGMTVFLADRMGLKRSVKIGLVLTMSNYLLLPIYSHSLTMALSGIFLVFLFFEFTIVTSMSLCTELLPAYRATMMSAFFATAGAGRVVGALIGGPIWLYGGIQATGIASAVITCLAYVSLTLGMDRAHRT